MSRIGTYGASQLYLTRLSAIQTRMNKTQLQVSTELKSTAYTGIASDANRIINLENEKTRADAFIRDNTLAETRLNAAMVSLDAMETSMKNFKKRVDEFLTNETKDQQKVEQLQEWAFDAMVDLQSYLAVSVDGQYLFSGGRVSDEPVKLPAETLDAFQQMFDGAKVTYPTSRAAALADVHLTATDTGALTFNTAAGTITAASDAFDDLEPGTRLTVGGLSPAINVTVQSVDAATNSIRISAMSSETTAAGTISYDSGNTTYTMSAGLTGALTFSPQGDTITSATVGGMTELAVGQAFKVSGTGSNDGTYEVVSNDGTTVTVKSTKLDFVQPTTTEAAATIGGVAAAAYGQLTFAGNNSTGALTISASTAGSLPVGTFPVGSTFTVAGATATGNNGTYRVVDNSGGTTLTVTRVTGGNYTVPTTANTTFDAESWYQGDNIQLQQRIDVDRSVDLGIYASDPAFEKAFRALALIAQGQYGTGGGLENNLERVTQARTLLQDALARNGTGIGPFGQEQGGDLQGLQARVGVTQGLIKNKNAKHTSFSGFLATRIADLERVDKTEAVARLLDDQTALETSYQALATVRGLSLLNFMK